MVRVIRFYLLNFVMLSIVLLFHAYFVVTCVSIASEVNIVPLLMPYISYCFY